MTSVGQCSFPLPVVLGQVLALGSQPVTVCRCPVDHVWRTLAMETRESIEEVQASMTQGSCIVLIPAASELLMEDCLMPSSGG